MPIPPPSSAADLFRAADLHPEGTSSGPPFPDVDLLSDFHTLWAIADLKDQGNFAMRDDAVSNEET
jgi:hypothetical protein